MIVEPRVHLRLKSIEFRFPIARVRGEELQFHECVLCTSEIHQALQMPARIPNSPAKTCPSVRFDHIAAHNGTYGHSMVEARCRLDGLLCDGGDQDAWVGEVLAVLVAVGVLECPVVVDDELSR